MVVEWTAEPSPDGAVELIAPPHVHRGDDEAWYVLSGTLGFRFDGVDREVGPGGAAMATAGTVHTYWNAGPDPARYLLVLTPRLRALIAALHAAGSRSWEEIFREHDSELVAES